MHDKYSHSICICHFLIKMVLKKSIFDQKGGQKSEIQKIKKSTSRHFRNTCCVQIWPDSDENCDRQLVGTHTYTQTFQYPSTVIIPIYFYTHTGYPINVLLSSASRRLLNFILFMEMNFLQNFRIIVESSLIAHLIGNFILKNIKTEHFLIKVTCDEI